MSTTDEAAADQRPTTTPDEAPTRDRGVLIVAGVLLVIAGLLIYGNLTMKTSATTAFGPQTFPWIVAGICLLAAALIVIEVIRHPRPVPSVPEQDAFSGVSVVHDPFDETLAPQLKAEAAEVPAGINWVKLGTALGALIGFTLILETVGWLLSATLLFWAMSVALGGRRHVPALIMGLGLASVIQVVFSGMLGMTLPAGLLLLGS